MPIGVVKEIVRVPEVTRIPKAPAFIEGVANLRGSILPIVNLRDRFDMPDGERTEDTRAVVIEVEGGWPDSSSTRCLRSCACPPTASSRRRRWSARPINRPTSGGWPS